MGKTWHIRALEPAMKFKRSGDAREFEVEIIARDGAELRVRIDGAEIDARVEPAFDGSTIIEIGERRMRAVGARDRNSILVAMGPAQFEFIRVEQRSGRRAHGLAAHEVIAPMPGKVLKVLVDMGDTVEAGQPLVVLEAMKMETTLYAESAAVIKKISALAGAMVDHGAVLIELAPATISSTHESPAGDG
jgi:acetyl/propionyl-CoA carboxylase alpha subunit